MLKYVGSSQDFYQVLKKIIKIKRHHKEVVSVPETHIECDKRS
jgi:hypothetical protein